MDLEFENSHSFRSSQSIFTGFEAYTLMKCMVFDGCFENINSSDLLGSSSFASRNENRFN